MDRVILQWNVQNWITVFLMATLGYAIVASVAMFAQKQSGKILSNG